MKNLITKDQHETIKTMLRQLRGRDGAFIAYEKIKNIFKVWTIAHLTQEQGQSVVNKLEEEWSEMANGVLGDLF